jgi:hypothetical protein
VHINPNMNLKELFIVAVLQEFPLSRMGFVLKTPIVRRPLS